MISREKLYRIIFESDTPPGKAFDVVLLIAILLSMLLVMLESVQQYSDQYGGYIRLGEYIFTALFTVEYAVRIYCAPRRWKYITSFYGIIDLVSILPTFLSILIEGSQYALVIRALRLLRVFRVLKLTHFLGEAEVLRKALRQSIAKITVFIGVVLVLIFIVGSSMYLIEGPENGFTSIPVSVYWAIVTLTTVGYGDIAPQTVAGQTLASVVMILGYGIIAVPTGIVSVELSRADTDHLSHGDRVKKKADLWLSNFSSTECAHQPMRWDRVEKADVKRSQPVE
ncbi:ion transporter [Tunicatimonas pelagia]|uniref:ion transporter n=1 Tax=Tunicatimonas pelagia TaxID=931531 RepID=UPI002666C796|nr:ion transporter [Tunicatimonas pelagia]WKN43124.1 ion transporter [Tunicatimonas pelagia]